MRRAALLHVPLARSAVITATERCMRLCEAVSSGATRRERSGGVRRDEKPPGPRNYDFERLASFPMVRDESEGAVKKPQIFGLTDLLQNSAQCLSSERPVSTVMRSSVAQPCLRDMSQSRGCRPVELIPVARGRICARPGLRSRRRTSPRSPLVLAHSLNERCWRLGAEGFKAAVRHSRTGQTRLAQLLNLAALVAAKPGWVNRDCSMVGVCTLHSRKIDPILQSSLHAVTRNSPLAPVHSSVSDDSPPHVQLHRCLYLSFSSLLFSFCHCILFSSLHVIICAMSLLRE